MLDLISLFIYIHDSHYVKIFIYIYSIYIDIEIEFTVHI